MATKSLLLLVVLAGAELALAKAPESVVVFRDDLTGGFVLGVRGDRLSHEAVAEATLVDEVADNGWCTLRIKTHDRFTTEEQYAAAGLAEGYLSATYMDQYAANQYANWGYAPSESPASLQEFMGANLAYMRNMSKQVTGDDLEDSIAKEVGLLLRQFDGIVEGYVRAKSTKNFTFEWGTMTEQDIFYLNAAGDLETLNDVPRFRDEAQRRVRRQFRGKDDDGMLDCSAFVRAVPDAGGRISDLVMAHATWRPYMIMNRVYKITTIAGLTTAFSSSPGFIASKDDFYIAPRGLTVYETTNGVYNEKLNDLISPHTLLTFVRPVIANRMADNGDDWTRIVSKHNSGTYCNQWGVVDMKRFVPGAADLPEGTFWIVEQIPGYSHRGDMTDVLSERGYWASYNIPYFKDVYQISGYPKLAATDPQKNYTACARAQIFAQRAPGVASFEDAKSLIRYNEYESDPLSLADPALAVASRYDLRTGAKGTAFGAVDAKVVSRSRLYPASTCTFSADVVSGPTAQDPSQTPPFSWADPRYSNISHVGLPEVWDFSYVTVRA